MTPRPDRRVVLRYAALQVPGLLVVITLVATARQWEWLDFPGWMAWAIPLAWLAKDALLFPLVWRAYEPDDRSSPGGLAGTTALVHETLDPKGWVRRGPELWRAELADPDGHAAPPGVEVRVVRVDGLVLQVEPVGRDAQSEDAAAAGTDAPSTSTRSSSSQSS